MEPWIAPSARRHRLSDARILAAYRNTVAIADRGDVEIRLGHDDHLVPIELAVTRRWGAPVIFHAMKMRSRFLPLYREQLG